MHARTHEALDAVWAGSTADAEETAQLEFKAPIERSLSDTFKMLAEAAACLANAHGGVLVVGVHDKKPGSDAFVGTTLDADQLVGRVYELTDPGLIVIAMPLTYQGTRLLEVTVPRSPDVHQVSGRATERVGKACQPMSASRITAVLADRRGDDWSSKESGLPVDGVSAVAEATVRDRLSRSSSVERAGWSKLPWPDVCRRLGVVTGEGLNNAGALLFVDSQRPLAQYVRRAPNAGLIAANETIQGPGLLAIARVLDLIESRTDRTALVTPSGAQLLVGDLPEIAVREVIVNAFMHRDYRSSEIIRVEHNASNLRVTSPGGLVPGVTLDNMLTVSSRCRNLTLAQAIRSLDLAESAGVGIDRMYASMAGVGHELPQFTTDDVSLTAALKGGPPNELIARFVSTLSDDRRGDPDTLLVLTYLLTHRTTTAAKMAPIVQRTESETEERLLWLASPGKALVERTPGTALGRRGEYRLVGDAIKALGSAVAYRTRTGDDTDRKIIDIVRELGMIKGRVVQSMFDIHPGSASRILSDLVDRGILIKTSKATRGPGVTYGPGPEFPASPRRSQAQNPREQDELDFP